MRASSPVWLDIVRHKVCHVRAPYMLILQHHDIPGPNRLAAPVSLAGAGVSSFVAPCVHVKGTEYRVRLLDMSPVPRTMLTAIVTSAAEERDAIMNALDTVLYGYPVGRPTMN